MVSLAIAWNTFTLPVKPIIYNTLALKVRFQVLARHGQAYSYDMIASARVSSVSLGMTGILILLRYHASQGEVPVSH